MLLVIVAASFAVMGLGALAAPVRVTALFGTPSLTRDGRSEVRAVYGGFGLAIAAALVAAALDPALAPGVVVAVAAALAGMAGGRLASAVLDGMPGRWPALFGAIEAAAAATLWIAG